MSSQEITSPIEAGIRTEKNVWGFWATAGFGFVVILIFVIAQVLVVGVFVVVKMVSDPSIELSQVVNTFSDNLGLIIALATCISAIVCIGFIILFVIVRRGARIKEYLGLRPITGMVVLVSLAITIVYIVLSSLLGTLLERPVSELLADAYSTSVWPVLLWVAIVIFAPVFEETLFRGFLFEGFRQSRIGVAGVIGLTAAAWALLHIQYGIYEIVVIFIFGIVLGIFRLKTGSLWSPLIMHAFFNLIAMIELALYSSGTIS
ncbi:lysostaphin resistance A-like protein [Chloroflexota bacterium]